MAKITFVTRDNETIVLEGTSGSVMELAVDNDVPGIDGDCGGVCSCATCHVHVAKEDFNEYSRLCCQIEINEALDGVVLQVAESD